MSTLILYLPLVPGASAPEYDYVELRSDQQRASHGRAVAALLPARIDRATEVVAVVPARAVSWHALALPARVVASVVSSRADPVRARAVLGGALEERLLDEVDHLHFAVFPGVTPDAPVWVAVCDRAWLRTALQDLEAAGRPVMRLVAECEPLQGNPGVRVVVTDAMAPAQAALCTAAGVTLLPLGDAAARIAALHTPLELVAEPAVMAVAEQAFGVSAHAQTRVQRLEAAARSPWNLAQWEFSPSKSGRAVKRLALAWQTVRQAPQWRPVRWVVAALLLVQVLALNAAAYKHNALLSESRSAIQSVVRQTFPNLTVIVDAPLQMQREVDALARTRGAEGADLAGLLTAVGAVLGADKPILAVDYAAGELRLRASGISDDDAAALASVLGVQGWTVLLQGEQLIVQAKEGR